MFEGRRLLVCCIVRLYEGIKLVCTSRILEFSSRSIILFAVIAAFCTTNALTAELIMFEQAGCVWCETFDREIAPVYAKTTEGQRAPLRRVNNDSPLPADLGFIAVERLAPLFVLIDKGREVGRIRGYPGEDHFWGLLGVLIKKLDADGTGRERS
jgi:hypothetical protein